MSLALQKALTPRNIQSDFRPTNIEPLNKEAMVGKMEAAELFHNSQLLRQSNEEDKVPFQTCQEAHDINVEELLEEDIPSSPRHYAHYYISVDDEFSFPSLESTMATTTPNISIFEKAKNSSIIFF